MPLYDQPLEINARGINAPEINYHGMNTVGSNPWDEFPQEKTLIGISAPILGSMLRGSN